MNDKSTKPMTEGRAQKSGSRKAKLTKKDIALRVIVAVPLYLGLLAIITWGAFQFAEILGVEPLLVWVVMVAICGATELIDKRRNQSAGAAQ